MSVHVVMSVHLNASVIEVLVHALNRATTTGYVAEHGNELGEPKYGVRPTITARVRLLYLAAVRHCQYFWGITDQRQMAISH